MKRLMTVTAYCPCRRCCGGYAGIPAKVRTMADGKLLYPIRPCAAGPGDLPFGTMIAIPGYNGGAPVPLRDRGGAIRGDRLDVLFASHEEAKRWGVRMLDVEILEQSPEGNRQ